MKTGGILYTLIRSMYLYVIVFRSNMLSSGIWQYQGFTVRRRSLSLESINTMFVSSKVALADTVTATASSARLSSCPALMTLCTITVYRYRLRGDRSLS